MPAAKSLNLALQGGGSHGAFTWGVIDRLLEDGRVELDGICGTSAGAINAVVYAHGMMRGGRDGAREALERFWRRISEAGALYSPVRASPFEGLAGAELVQQLSYSAFETVTRVLSPYQFNPFNFNPLREVLAQTVDFDAVRACDCAKLFLCATNVRTGKPRIFQNREVTADAVLASSCLPFLFQAVEIEGEAYWDGGYIGNPPIYPLIYDTATRDVLIVHVNPLVRTELPRRADEIMNRINEISFNSSLVREMRAIAFVQKLIADGWLKEQHSAKLKMLLMHAIRTDEALCEFGVQTKLRADWDFLARLRDLGREHAARWLDANYDAIGVHQTVDLRAEYL